MKKFIVTNRELRDAIGRATPSLARGKYVRGDGFEFDKHCSVCAVGGIMREIPRLNSELMLRGKEYSKEWRMDFKTIGVNILHCVISETIKGEVQYFDEDKDHDCNSADELIDYEIENHNWLAAISIFFESELDMKDSNEFKAKELQKFIESRLPTTIEIEI